MSEVEFTFNGPPPANTRRGEHKSALRLALDAHPGEWATVELRDNATAAARQFYFKKIGYEATRRGSTLYVRSVA